jgi:uncharacterized membrane protein YeaQ/YmgE (transglycosylase-associated protein family)
MSLADQVTVTYVVVGIAVGLISWFAIAKRGGVVLILSIAAGLIGAFGVEVLLAHLFGIYPTLRVARHADRHQRPQVGGRCHPDGGAHAARHALPAAALC